MIKKSFLTAIIILTTFNTSYGQDSNSTPNVTGQIEEILVTATRRTETDILTTPIPMTALNDSMIEKYAPRDLQEAFSTHVVSMMRFGNHFVLFFDLQKLLYLISLHHLY